MDASLRAIRALVIGDAMVDAYLTTRAAGVSDEAPVAILDWIGVERALGGMLNVAASLRAAGADVETIATIGDDELGAWMREQCESLGIEARWFRDGRPTIGKTRVSCGPDFLARVDVEQTDAISGELEPPVETAINDAASRTDVIVVADYAKGLLTERVAKAVVAMGRRLNKPVIVDTKPQSMAWYAGATLFTPNESETWEWAKLFGLASPVVEGVGAVLARDLGGAVLITRGPEGMSLCLDGEKPIRIPATAEIIASTSGAGDIVVAVMAIALAEGWELEHGAREAAKVVGRALARPGTCALRPEDLSGGS